MATMLADYGGLGVSEWLWVGKASTTVRCFKGQGHMWRCCERRCVTIGWKAMVTGFKISVESDTTQPRPTRLDTDRTKSDARYDEFDYEILKSQFQTINLVHHED